MIAKEGCQPSMIDIVVNGESRTVSEGQTILGLIRELDLEPSRLAVELDRSIVKQPRWGETVVPPGATIEIVQFVGGG